MTKTSRATAPHYFWQGDCEGWRLLDAPDLSVIHERMPPGRAETRHHHTTARQVFFCLSGALEIELDGVDHHLTSGEALPVPAKAVHQVRNPGPEAAEFLVISAPSTRADRIESPG